jgi:hypothetical protein
MAIAIAGFLVLAWNFVNGNLACDTDTAYCAITRAKNGYYGASVAWVKKGDRVDVAFESLRHGNGVSFDVAVSGYVCIIWAHERIYPRAAVNGRSVKLVWQTDTPLPGCHRSKTEIPWNRADGVTSRWQYTVLIALPALALALLALSALAQDRRRRTLHYAASAAVGAAIVATIVAW